jgi:hypothetical protein
VQKSASKTKKLRKGPLPAPGGVGDVDDAAEAAAAQAVIDRAMPRTETVGRLMQPQEYSAADLANRRTGYGAFENEGDHSYERVIDENGKTNWKATQDNENNKKAKMILNWMKEAAKSSAKSKLGLVLPSDSDLARNKSFSTIKNVLRPIAEGPVGKMVAQKLKNDFNIKDVKDLSNASEGAIQGAIASAVGLMTFNPVKENAHLVPFHIRITQLYDPLVDCPSDAKDIGIPPVGVVSTQFIPSVEDAEETWA